MKLSRKRLCRNNPEPSQKRISAYFQVLSSSDSNSIFAAKTNSKSKAESSHSDASNNQGKITNNDKGEDDECVVSCVVNSEKNVSSCEPQPAISKTPTRLPKSTLFPNSDKSDLFIISPSPELKKKCRLRIGTSNDNSSNKRKFIHSPTSKLALKLKMKPDAYRCKKRIANFGVDSVDEQENYSSNCIEESLLENLNTHQNLSPELKSDGLFVSTHSILEKKMTVAKAVERNEVESVESCLKASSENCLLIKYANNQDIKEKMSHLSLTDDDLSKLFQEDFSESLTDCDTANRKLMNSISRIPTEVKDIYIKNSRHQVIRVDKIYESGELILTLLFLVDNTERRCILKGFWFDSVVKEGDIVNVLAEFDEKKIAIVDNDAGLIVINPDILISGTTVVGSVFCQRKAILSEWFRGIDRGDCSGVVGTIIHELFQQSLGIVETSGLLSRETLNELLARIIAKESFLLEMYRHKDKFDENCGLVELRPFLDKILTWTNKHMFKICSDNGVNSSNTKIVKVHDIEENIWSPRLGLKGKLDVTAEVKLHSLGKSGLNTVMPLELKTGKASFSSEHRGQVMLYSMLLSERRTSPNGGLLLYLKENKMEIIKDDFKCQQGLVQMRNEIASRVAQPVIFNEAVQSTANAFSLTKLPEPMCSTRFCEKCPYLTTCAIFQQTDKDYIKEEVTTSTARKFFTESTDHLNEKDLNYFVKWCSFLFLEGANNDRGMEIKNIWCTSGEEREKCGAAYTKLLLMEVTKSDSLAGLHRFTRRSGDKFEFSKIVMTVSQYVIVSVEKPLTLAVGTGYLTAITSDYIDVKLDRNLYERDESSKLIYRIDSISMKSSWNNCLANVARLMSSSSHSQHLRNIVVHRQLPSYSAMIPKSVGIKVRPILRRLNKSQQSAIFKALMCQDYLLIKGMPGAGKTATIVALVATLVSIGCSVLLTSHTHSAVDNILLKLVEKDIDFLRLGNSSRVKPELSRFTSQHILKNCKSINEMDTIIKSKLVVATTCLGTNNAILSQRTDFDYCIVDEASQILQAACLGPLFISKKFILVGDPNQLPPIVRCKTVRSVGNESLFSLLDCPEATIELNTQYRMNREIVRLANALIYGGSLTCASDEVAESFLKLKEIGEALKTFNVNEIPMLRILSSTSIEKSVLLINTDTIPIVDAIDGQSKAINEVESAVVLLILQFFIKAGLSRKQIGVIAPFRDQVTYITNLLKSYSSLHEIEINTVDQFQGRDKDVIIMSCVRNVFYSNKEESILNDRRRINVAITRARTKLIIIGRKSTLIGYDPMRSIFTNLNSEQEISLEPQCLEVIRQISKKYLEAID